MMNQKTGTARTSRLPWMIALFPFGHGCGTAPVLPSTGVNTLAPEFNDPPTAAFSVDTVSGRVPLTVTFDLYDSFDPDGSIASFRLEFGDGQHISGPGEQLSEFVEYTYENPGTFSARLTVTDDLGDQDFAILVISVTDPFLVNTTADTFADDGLVSLAEALVAASEDPMPNRITFDPQVFSNAQTGIIKKQPDVGSFFLDGEGDVIDASGSSVTIDGTGYAFVPVVIGADDTAIIALSVRTDEDGVSPILIDVNAGTSQEVTLERCHVEQSGSAGVFIENLQNATLICTETTFTNLGDQAIRYEKADQEPPTPFPLRIDGTTITAHAPPGAAVELFQGNNIFADQFLLRTTADENGLFTVDASSLTSGIVITATSTAPGGSTSTTNILAGLPVGSFDAALLVNTGPDAEEPVTPADQQSSVLRWATGTQLFYRVTNPLGEPWNTEIKTIVDNIVNFTRGGVTASVGFGPSVEAPPGAIVIPITYVPADDPEHDGKNGLTNYHHTASGELTEASITLSMNPYFGTAPHEIGHSLGLTHLCASGQAVMFTNACTNQPDQPKIDPLAPTFYDVRALHVLYDPQVSPGMTLEQLQSLGLVP